MDSFNGLESPQDSLSGSFKPRSLWKVLPFWETTIGLSTSFSIYGYPMEVEIGYEYLTYPDFIHRIQFPSNGSSRARNAYTNLTFKAHIFLPRLFFEE